MIYLEHGMIIRHWLFTSRGGILGSGQENIPSSSYRRKETSLFHGLTDPSLSGRAPQVWVRPSSRTTTRRTTTAADTSAWTMTTLTSSTTTTKTQVRNRFTPWSQFRFVVGIPLKPGALLMKPVKCKAVVLPLLRRNVCSIIRIHLNVKQVLISGFKSGLGQNQDKHWKPSREPHHSVFWRI